MVKVGDDLLTLHCCTEAHVHVAPFSFSLTTIIDAGSAVQESLHEIVNICLKISKSDGASLLQMNFNGHIR